jgi:hypothetical protein
LLDLAPISLSESLRFEITRGINLACDRGAAVLFTSLDPDQARLMSEYVTVLRRGERVYTGAFGDLDSYLLDLAASSGYPERATWPANLPLTHENVAGKLIHR